MKKTAILLTALLILTILAACNSDSGSNSVGAGGPMSDEFFAVSFNENNVATLMAEEAFVYDDPIVLENDGDNLGGWVLENDPAAYWGITIPETGDYAVTVTYARGEASEVRGFVEAQYWDEETEEWGNWAGYAFDFVSTGAWSQYADSNTRVFVNLEEGQTYRLMVRPSSTEETDGEYFINLYSILIEPASEEEATDDVYAEGEDDYPEEETDDTAGEEYVSADVPLILTGDGVYYHHESGEGNLQFHPDGRVQHNTADAIRGYDYTIEGDTVYITEEGEPVTELTMLDLCTLEDLDGTIYAVPDSEGQELVERSIYWMNAGDVGIAFDVLGILRTVGAPGGETEGSYEIDGTTVYIELGEQSFELEIQNKRVLYSYEDGSVFVRLP